MDCKDESLESSSSKLVNPRVSVEVGLVWREERRDFRKQTNWKNEPVLMTVLGMESEGEE